LASDTPASSSAARAVVHWDGDAWVAECDGVREYTGPDQIEAEVAARRVLGARGGGELLIRGVDGRQLKRIVVDATP
jgi:hypothetical protein